MKHKEAATHTQDGASPGYNIVLKHLQMISADGGPLPSPTAAMEPMAMGRVVHRGLKSITFQHLVNLYGISTKRLW